MILLITGPSHSGKTKAAYDLTAKYGISTLSLDHLKMGLIRSGHTHLTPLSNTQSLTDLIWPIAKEIIKTAIENDQDLIVEGLYIPFNWKDSFDQEYLEKIEYYCIILLKNILKKISRQSFNLKMLWKKDKFQTITRLKQPLKTIIISEKAQKIVG